ncbi:caspase family protein [Cupriavidus pauculus]|uniref:caspase family protein n=1 Tax=Cupriavidus pauculus TaxID=82633 RepID=UPI001D0C66CA|nr:caspase family protein [Cupriavidus pauculus]
MKSPHYIGALSFATIFTLFLAVNQVCFAAPPEGPSASAPATRAPRRAAILVGVKTYRPTNYVADPASNIKMLRNLGTPCEDVDEISKQLQMAGWRLDNDDKNAEIHTYCDVELHVVRDDIEKRIEAFDHPDDLLIIFFAGHGAEINGRNYFFGKNATLDMATAVNRLASDSKSPLFLGAAMELNNTILALAGIAYHGNILVIVAACRDDPVTYSELATSLKVPIGPPLYETRPTGIRVFYANTPGKTISDGIGLSNLGRAFAKNISREKAVYRAIIESQTEVINATKNGSVENPVAVGDFNQYEICFYRCKTSVTPAFYRHDTLRLTSARVPGRFLKIATEEVAPEESRREGPPPKGFTVVRSANQPIQSPLTSTPIGVDIYWCESGGLRKHKEQADALGKKLATLADTWTNAAPSARIGAIRTKPLSDLENQKPGFRFARNSIRYSGENDKAGIFAKLVSKTFLAKAYVEPTRGDVTDTINVFLCSGGEKFPTSSRLFIQAAKPSQRGIGIYISGEIERKMPDLWVADAIDIRQKVQDSSPEHTLVKYFTRGDEGLAMRIAGSLDPLLPSAPLVVFAPPKSGSTDKLKGLVEIWLGRDLEPEAVITTPQQLSVHHQ